MPRVLDFVLGGWTISYIGNYASGTPLRFTGSGIPGWNGRANRPDLNNPSGSSLLAGFDPSNFDFATIAQPNPNLRYVAAGVFSDHRPFTLGTAGFTSNIREPWSLNEDFGFRKAFTIREGMKVEIRAELLNAFNRHRFSGVETSVLNPRFGQITGVSGNRTGQIGMRLDF